MKYWNTPPPLQLNCFSTSSDLSYGEQYHCSIIMQSDVTSITYIYFLVLDLYTRGYFLFSEFGREIRCSGRNISNSSKIPVFNFGKSFYCNTVLILFLLLLLFNSIIENSSRTFLQKNDLPKVTMKPVYHFRLEKSTRRLEMWKSDPFPVDWTQTFYYRHTESSLEFRPTQIYFWVLPVCM